MDNEDWTVLVMHYQEAEAAFEAANSAVTTRCARGEGPTDGELEDEEAARIQLIAARHRLHADGKGRDVSPPDSAAMKRRNDRSPNRTAC